MRPGASFSLNNSHFPVSVLSQEIRHVWKIRAVKTIFLSYGCDGQQSSRFPLKFLECLVSGDNVKGCNKYFKHAQRWEHGAVFRHICRAIRQRVDTRGCMNHELPHENIFMLREKEVGEIDVDTVSSRCGTVCAGSRGGKDKKRTKLHARKREREKFWEKEVRGRENNEASFVTALRNVGFS